MTKTDEFLSFINKILNDHLEKRTLPQIQQIGIKTSIYHIFETNHDLEYTFYELMNYLDHSNDLASLRPKVEQFYNNL